MLRSMRDGERLLVGLDGELDHFCAQSVRRELDSMLRERGGSVAVIHMNDHVSRIFHMSGMDRVIHQLDKVQEARR